MMTGILFHSYLLQRSFDDESNEWQSQIQSRRILYHQCIGNDEVVMMRKNENWDVVVDDAVVDDENSFVVV